MADSYYAKTQRIVLLIDLSPLLNLQNPNLYIQSLLKSAHTLLDFQPLSQSLSSFKLFFSSLSPFVSSSTLLSILSKSPHSSSYFNPNSLSFNRSHETLISLSKTLDLVSDLNNNSAGLDGASRADFAASSILQVVQDHAWEVHVDDSVGMSSDTHDVGLSDFVPSNLVILFSPICRSSDNLSHYLRVNGEGEKDGILVDHDKVSEIFAGLFQHVNFVAKDIHICWVDINYELESSEEKVQSAAAAEESKRLLEFFQSGFRSLGWGFSSTSSIVLGAALVPFGLVYPSIGVLPKFHSLVNPNPCTKVKGHLNLEISDSKGEPLQCKCCDLHLLDLKPQQRIESTESPLKWESLSFEDKVSGEATSVCESFGDSVVQVDVKTIWKGHETMMAKNSLSNVVLVYESLGRESKRIKVEPCSSEYFADKVLGILSEEMNEVVKKMSVSFWPVLLSFLYRGGYQALVSVSSSNGSSRMGILQPFTVQSAFLSFMTDDTALASDRNYGVENIDHDIHGSQLVQGSKNQRRNNKRTPQMYDLSWSSFCKAALGQTKMVLEEAYFYRSNETSKKLKFIKCWMKQASRSILHFRCSFDIIKEASNNVVLDKKRIDDVPEDRGRVVHAELFTDASFSESSEAFFGNLDERIQHGLQSGVDLEALAQRLVKSSIYWLGKTPGTGNNVESQPSATSSDDNGAKGNIVRELARILLKDSAQISEKHKENALLSSEDRIREYELQILFRMEILQSDIADGIKDSMKRRFIKQICSFLEMVQCNVEGGFFGDFNLHEYVSKIIKNRYSQKLGDVTYGICQKMDLLPFDYDNETPNSLLNSEESSQSWREKPAEQTMVKKQKPREQETSDNNKAPPLSSEDSLFPWEALQIDKTSHTGLHPKDNTSQRLEEAREKRERARRFSSFTRGVPVLQRVWAPKRLKQPSRSKLDSVLKHRSSSTRVKFPESCDKVCETPMIGRTSSWSNDRSINNDQDLGGRKRSPPSSVYKALFRDD